VGSSDEARSTNVFKSVVAAIIHSHPGERDGLITRPSECWIRFAIKFAKRGPPRRALARTPRISDIHAESAPLLFCVSLKRKTSESPTYPSLSVRDRPRPRERLTFRQAAVKPNTIARGTRDKSLWRNRIARLAAGLQIVRAPRFNRALAPLA